ncbi:hypothetical protein DsansV1_C23g0176211 [Dioscorea sansibarensis]
MGNFHYSIFLCERLFSSCLEHTSRACTALLTRLNLTQAEDHLRHTSREAKFDKEKDVFHYEDACKARLDPPVPLLVVQANQKYAVGAYRHYN